MLKKYYLLLLVFCAVTAFAQPARMAPGGKMPAIGRLYGKIVDAQSKEPIEYATLTLFAMNKDSVITGGITKPNGDFSLDKIPFGRFRLRIQFIGYKTILQNVSITPQHIEQDLGNIAVEIDSKALKEVVIEGERATVTMSIDKRVYNPEKDLSAKGGTGLDVMKNVPGVTVDADGNVALRNSSPTIFIDGRPTTLTLDQIPADQIDRIEVITNPSAKYDASATGGILNIFLKKNTKPGYNGMVIAGIGTNNRYNLMTNLNIKEGRTNFFVSYNLNTAENPTKGFTNRTTLADGRPVNFFNQDNKVTMKNLFQNGRVGFDYNINNRNSFTLSQAGMFGNMNTNDVQTYRQQDELYRQLSSGNRTADQKGGWENFTSQAQFRHTYPKAGKEWTTDFTYNHSNRRTDADFVTNNFDSNNIATGQDRQLNKGSGSSDMFTYQFDFTNPLSDTAKIEFGIKANYRLDRSKLDVSNYNASQDMFVADTILTNDYKINDLVTAAYFTYSNMIWGIGYQAGLRFEQTHFTGELVGKNQRFEYYYPDGFKNLGRALFPSLYLSKKLKGNQEVQANFSRKINRPGWMQVMPFIMFSDKQNYRIGNPNLAPEFINMAEVNYNKIYSTGNFLSSVYIKYLENAITAYVYPLQNDSSILVSTFINGKSSLAYGWENNVKQSFFKRKMDVTVNANIFYTTISATANNANLQNDGFSWNGKVIVAYKLPKQFTAQVNGGYEAPRIIPQGKTKEVYAMDISLSKEIIKTLSATLTLSDVFNTRRFGTIYDSETFTQDMMRRRDTRFLRISISWRFGETDASLFRKRKPQQRDSQGGMEMDY